MSKVKIKTVAENFRDAFNRKNNLNEGLAQLAAVDVSLFPESQRDLLRNALDGLKKTVEKVGDHPDFEMIDMLLKQKKPESGKFEALVAKTHLESFKINESQAKSFLAKILTLKEENVSSLQYDAFIINNMASLGFNKFVVVMSDIVIIYSLDNKEYLTLDNFEKELTRESLNSVEVSVCVEDSKDEDNLKEFLEF